MVSNRVLNLHYSKMIIALTGFMGCGKSHVAACLAQRMGCFFFDLDDTIEMEEGASVSDIFARKGEKAFRELEYKYLGRIFSDYDDFPTDMVLALGGGTVLNTNCTELLKAKATVVYLRESVDELVRNLEITGISHRPLLAGTDNLRKSVQHLLSDRSVIYEKTADIIIDADGLEFDAVAADIINRLP